MAVKYKIYQSNRSGETYGKYYARAVHDQTITTDQLADIMQNNCTVKRSDILAVISELVETMTTQLQNSNKVKLDRFGTFKIGISTSGADSLDEFSVAKNIKGAHILFYPETTVNAATGVRSRAFLSGVNMSEASEYYVD